MAPPDHVTGRSSRTQRAVPRATSARAVRVAGRGHRGEQPRTHRRRRNRGGAMSAKHKLNAAHFYGALLVAGLLAWVTGSLIVFLIALVALLVAGYHAGDLRR